MTISATMVRDLREKTGAGIMECKAALAEASGDMAKAIEVLRKRGLKTAEKKAGRRAADGLVAAWVSPGRNVGALVEVNCETDFVARTDRFAGLARSLVALVGADEAAEVVKDAIASLGENIVVRRAARLALPEAARGVITSYLHAGGKIGVLVGVRCGSDGAARSEELARLAKALAIQDKIIQGRLEKFFMERCLMDQPFIRDPEGKQRVRDVLKAAEKSVGEPVSATAFVRFRLGEGAEKPATD